MQCANPRCRQSAHDLQDGTLRLVELDVAPEDRVVRSDGGFPVCAVPSRYFWLCAQCSKVLIIKRWTLAGLILEPIGCSHGYGERLQGTRKPLATVSVLRPRLQNVFGKSA